jgi:hypothetical protein
MLPTPDLVMLRRNDECLGADFVERVAGIDQLDGLDAVSSQDGHTLPDEIVAGHGSTLHLRDEHARGKP